MQNCSEYPVTVRHGFPLIARVKFGKPEPDVGLLNEYISDMEVVTVQGKDASWLHLDDEELLDIERQVFSTRGSR